MKVWIFGIHGIFATTAIPGAKAIEKGNLLSVAHF